MERYEIGGDERLISLVEAASRGEEASITRDGEVVATVTAQGTPLRTRDGGKPGRGIDWAVLDRLHALIPDEAKGGGVDAIRALRDAGY